MSKIGLSIDVADCRLLTPDVRDRERDDEGMRSSRALRLRPQPLGQPVSLGKTLHQAAQADASGNIIVGDPRKTTLQSTSSPFPPFGQAQLDWQQVKGRHRRPLRPIAAVQPAGRSVPPPC